MGNVSTTVADVVVPNGRSTPYKQQKTMESDKIATEILNHGPKSKKCPIHPSMKRK